MFDTEQWQLLSSAIVDASERAAAACAPYIGKGDKQAADGAAVAAFTAAMDAMPFAVTVATGEGELDKAPMFAAGDRFGSANGPAIDIAVDPLEGTQLCADGRAGSMTAIAAAPAGAILAAPDGYMEKRMAGPDCPADLLDLDRPIGDAIRGLARQLSLDTSAIGVCFLDKPRHASLKAAIIAAGASPYPIDDGDIPAALWVCDADQTGIHLYAGTGGSPEGLVSAAALRCLGGQMTARFIARDAAQQRRLDEWPTKLLDRQWHRDQLISGPAIFCISSVTGTSGLAALAIADGRITVESLSVGPGPQIRRMTRSFS